MTALDLDSISCTNAENYCTTPTADGSGSAIHPSVIVFDSVWNGYKYWMSVSGYLNNNDQLENTHILCSNDGTTWSPPTGLTNPLETLEGLTGYHSDSALCYHDGKLYVFDRFTDRTNNNQTDYRYSYSTDGVNWTAPVIIFSWASGSIERSASVVWDGTQFVMYTVNGTTYRRTSNTIVDGVWSEPTATTLPQSWHNDVHYSVLDDTYYALLQSDSWVTTLELYKSSNGINSWTARADTFLSTSIGGWDSTYLYRSALFRTIEGLKIWYSGSADLNWRIGYTYASDPNAPASRSKILLKKAS